MPFSGDPAGTPRAPDPDVQSRFAFALILVAVGCGSFGASENEPIPAPAPAPSAPPAPADQPAEVSDPAPSNAPTDPPASGNTPPTAGCKVGFQKDVLPKLSASCGQAGCHSEFMNRPFIAASSAQKTHDELMEFDFGSLEWSDPHSEYSGASDPDLKKAIDSWRLCGAKLD